VTELLASLAHLADTAHLPNHKDKGLRRRDIPGGRSSSGRSRKTRKVRGSRNWNIHASGKSGSFFPAVELKSK
jgi:hypothetical protein